MKIKLSPKFICNSYSKRKYVVHVKTLKRASSYWLILKKVHRISASVNNSNSTAVFLKHTCHVNPGAGKKGSWIKCK